MKGTDALLRDTRRIRDRLQRLKESGRLEFPTYISKFEYNDVNNAIDALELAIERLQKYEVGRGLVLESASMDIPEEAKLETVWTKEEVEDD